MTILKGALLAATLAIASTTSFAAHAMKNGDVMIITSSGETKNATLNTKAMHMLRKAKAYAGDIAIVMHNGKMYVMKWDRDTISLIGQ